MDYKENRLLNNKQLNEAFYSWIESKGVEKDNVIPSDFQSFIVETITENKELKTFKTKTMIEAFKLAEYYQGLNKSIEEILSQLKDRGGFDVLIEGINERLNKWK